MKFDLSRYLSRSLQEYQREKVGLDCNINVRIIPTPGHVEAPWCTPILLEIVAQSETRIAWTRDFKRIEQLANDVVLYLRQDKWFKNRFIFEASSRGHINIQPTENVYDEFIIKLFAQGGAALYQDAPLLFNDPVREIKEIALPKRADWFDLNLSDTSEDLAKLRAKIKNQKQTKLEDVLMTLFLTIDSELDVQAYLQNIAGKEHRPWYFDRTLRDLEKSSKEFEISITSIAGYNIKKLLAESRADFFQPDAKFNLMALARFLQRLADEFYRFYNNPLNRLASPAKSDINILKTLEESFATGYQLLKNSCVDSSEVLRS